MKRFARLYMVVIAVVSVAYLLVIYGLLKLALYLDTSPSLRKWRTPIAIGILIYCWWQIKHPPKKKPDYIDVECTVRDVEED